MEFIARLDVASKNGLPMPILPAEPVLSVTNFASTDPAPASNMLPVPLALSVTAPEAVLLAMTFPLRLMFPAFVAVEASVTLRPAMTLPVVLMPPVEFVKTNVLPACEAKRVRALPLLAFLILTEPLPLVLAEIVWASVRIAAEAPAPVPS